MKTLKLLVQVSAASFVVLLLPFLFLSFSGLGVPHVVETLAVGAVYLLPIVIVLLVVYVIAVGVSDFINGLRSRSTAKSIVAFSFLVIAGFVVAGIVRVLSRR